MTAVLDSLAPGLYELPADVYHADRSALSSSGARALLDCPARFAWRREHPRPPKQEYDIGHAAHRLLLGAGAELTVIEADSYRTKTAQQAKAGAYAAGRIPILPAELAEVEAMIAALRAHRFAGRLFTGGLAEPVLVWVDQATGVRCKAMLDYWRPPWIVDYKTTKTAAPRALSRNAAEYGYHIQLAWYLDGVQSLGLAELPSSVLVWQEKIAPYLVTVSDLDEEFLAVGQASARLAREIYRDCTKASVWPEYATDVVRLRPPRWLNYQGEETWD